MHNSTEPKMTDTVHCVTMSPSSGFCYKLQQCLSVWSRRLGMSSSQASVIAFHYSTAWGISPKASLSIFFFFGRGLCQVNTFKVHRKYLPRGRKRTPIEGDTLHKMKRRENVWYTWLDEQVYGITSDEHLWRPGFWVQTFSLFLLTYPTLPPNPNPTV